MLGPNIKQRSLVLQMCFNTIGAIGFCEPELNKITVDGLDVSCLGVSL